jgi:hypothetical protein
MAPKPLGLSKSLEFLKHPRVFLLPECIERRPHHLSSKSFKIIADVWRKNLLALVQIS